ncbi:hypothetical protein, partial [Morganella morganii]|uniref:hypothetical protein n=1 Tax=Morganella morganii TaxID=582 RepID=UPI003EBAA4F7
MKTKKKILHLAILSVIFTAAPSLVIAETFCGDRSSITYGGGSTLMNPLMILVKIIKLRWIHILSYDQMVSRKINNQTTRCANSIF